MGVIVVINIIDNSELLLGKFEVLSQDNKYTIDIII